MQAYQARVAQERDELLERVLELIDFMKSPVFGELPAEDASLLHRQLGVMQEYLEILDKRVATFLAG